MIGCKEIILLSIYSFLLLLYYITIILVYTSLLIILWYYIFYFFFFLVFQSSSKTTAVVAQSFTWNLADTKNFSECLSGDLRTYLHGECKYSDRRRWLEVLAGADRPCHDGRNVESNIVDGATGASS